MSELATRCPKDAYTPADLIKDLHAGIWTELKPGPIEIDLYRRNLQRAYVDLLAGFLENPPEDSDLPALARAELQKLSAEHPRFSVGADAARSSPPTCRTSRPAPTTRWTRSPRLRTQRSPLGLPVRRGGDEAWVTLRAGVLQGG